MYDGGTYDTLWEAGTFYEAVGGAFEISLDGSTISASGSFYTEADIATEPVDGEFEARC